MEGDLSVFSTPTEMIFGAGASARAGDLARRLGKARVFTVSDRGVLEAGVLDPALEAVRAAGLAVEVFADVPHDPTLGDVTEITRLALDFGADCVIAAGGGSGLCAGKGCALAATNGGDLHECTGRDRYQHPPLPVIAIPTTAGSGSEVSRHTTLSDERTLRKTGVDGYTNAPRFAVLDSELVQTVPRQQAVASGIDAFLHALEAYLSTRATPLTDAIALHALEQIWHLLPAALEGDRRARGQMLLASSIANVACGNAGLTLIHAMNGGVTFCYRVRGHLPVPYGMIHGALMGPVLRFYVPAVSERLASLAPLLQVHGHGTAAVRAERVVEAILEWAWRLGAPRALPWGRIPDEDVELIVQETLARPRPSPRPAAAEDLRAIVLQALAG